MTCFLILLFVRIKSEIENFFKNSKHEIQMDKLWRIFENVFSAFLKKSEK